MKKILFIVPPNLNYEDFTNPSSNVKSKNGFGSVLTDVPLGIQSLSSYLKKHCDVKVSLIDFNVVLNKMDKFDSVCFKDFFIDYLSKHDFKPDLIGISSLFVSSYKSLLDIGECCRKIFSKSIIIAGGGVPTNMYIDIFKNTNCFDALCYGEGEKPLLELVKANNKKEFLKTHQSWITKEKVENKQSFQHDFIENLDEIPFNDFSILNIEDYNLNSTISAYPSIENKRFFSIMFSRGCPFKCCFCSSHSVHGREMRFLSLKRVKEDLEKLKEMGGKIIVAQDDHFMSSKSRALNIIEIIKDLKMSAFFQNSLTLFALDKKVLETLKGAGINQLVLSVESGSERVLRKVMHKPLNLSIVKRVLKDCRDLGIYTDAQILIGLPGETKQDLEDAKDFLKTINANWFRISSATPLAGSEMFDICIKNNYFKEDYFNCNIKKAVIETEDFTAEYIQEEMYLLNLELNFINNSDIKLGEYKTALIGFENVIKVRSDHAFAYYFAAKCYKMMGLDEKYFDYKTKYQKIIEKSTFWKNYVKQFNLNN